MEDEEADEDGAEGADACPDRVGGADGDGLGGFGEEHGAEDVEEGEASHPLPIEQALESFGFSQTESEAHFAEAGDDEYYPVHMEEGVPSPGHPLWCSLGFPRKTQGVLGDYFTMSL